MGEIPLNIHKLNLLIDFWINLNGHLSSTSKFWSSGTVEHGDITIRSPVWTVKNKYSKLGLTHIKVSPFVTLR